MPNIYLYYITQQFLDFSPSSAEVKMSGSVPPTSPHAFVMYAKTRLFCLYKQLLKFQRDEELNFYVPLKMKCVLQLCFSLSDCRISVSKIQTSKLLGCFRHSAACCETSVIIAEVADCCDINLSPPPPPFLSNSLTLYLQSED
jgi:hypothetical protein